MQFTNLLKRIIILRGEAHPFKRGGTSVIQLMMTLLSISSVLKLSPCIKAGEIKMNAAAQEALL